MYTELFANTSEPNLITLTDSYKITHWNQNPLGTRSIYSFFESRGGDFPNVLFFGLQYIMKKYLCGKVITAEKIERAKRRLGRHFSNNTYMNERGWEYLLKAHDGRLPLHIKAVPEGCLIPTKNVLFTIENTDPEVPWLTNYIEPLLSQVWYPSSVGIVSYSMRQRMLQALIETGDPSLIDYKVHDFGLRGSTSIESAMIGGAAHLINFRGTDTLPALDLLEDYYHEPNAGHSIAAAEHSSITSWGRAHEADAYRSMLEQFPTGLVAVVSDSYDIYHACREIWGKQLKQAVLARDGVVVIRPDSGHPPEVVLRVLEILGEAFGYTINTKGYKVLHPKVRVIQGDGIDLSMLDQVLTAMKSQGWSADNIAFGSGGGLLQKVNRDMQKYALKCSAIEIHKTWYDVHKDPITDPGKRSKAGRLALVREDGNYRTVREDEAARLALSDNLLSVYRNGSLLKDWMFSEVRAHAQAA